jgi:DNA helicase-2/ATP-dependent DNA helicase PcrA
MLFKEMLDRYVSTVEQSFIPKENFIIGSQVIYRYEELNNLFINNYKVWPVAERINEIKKHLSSRLKLKKESIINGLHDECDMKIRQIKLAEEDSEKRQKKIIEAIDLRNKTIDRVESYSKKAVKEYISKISKLNPYEYYKNFIADRDLFDAIASETGINREVSDYTRRHTEETLKSGFIELEDLAPIIYLKFCIYGMDEKIPVKHIVIDEAQDFSAFQLYVLRRIIKDSSFTILGDLNQGIHSYRGVQNWDEISAHVFKDRKVRYLTLEQSYRTTVEIMEAANKVIGKLNDSTIPPAKPVIRHGEKVWLVRKSDMKETASDISGNISQLQEMQYKSMAVICKTTDECKAMYSLLKKDFGEIYVISGREAAYKSGLVIVPSYLAKGLEFDAVFIANGSAEVYQENELDIKLLYVAMTRPLHRLYIYCTGKLSPLLEDLET